MLDKNILKNRIVTRRTFMISLAKYTLFGGLISRLVYLQFFKKEEYEKLSEKNRVSLLTIKPIRGMIYDKNSILVADSENRFFLKLDRRQSREYKNSLEKLYKLLNYDDDKIKKIEEKIAKSSFRIPVVIEDNLSWENVSIMEEIIYEFPGLFIESSYSRKYLLDESMSHVTGYVGKVNENEKKLFDYKAIPDLEIGKSAIEKYYETYLQGQFGFKEMEVDARGLYVNELRRVSPIAGRNIYLNIDSNLQKEIYNLLDPRGSSVVLMDVNTGNIEAMVSSPSFDPNEFVGGVSYKYWDNVRDNIYKPLINKTIQSQYPPGSTFKIVTVLSALEHGVSPQTIFNCKGSIKLGNINFRCWKPDGHGNLNMIDAITKSCNCYMYNLSMLIGESVIINFAKKIGLGQKTNVDLTSESSGFVPDKIWKLSRFKYDWTKGDSFNLSIGQGALLTTPIQLANMIAIIANGGNLLIPKIANLNNIELSDDEKYQYNFDEKIRKKDLLINKANIEILKRGLFNVVNSHEGTSFRNMSSKVAFAGKTGTSQVIAKKNKADDLSKQNVKWENRNHGLFVGFAPFENPKYAISVVVDHGGSGSGAAAPIAKKIFEMLF